jgi:ribosome assembly protein 1
MIPLLLIGKLLLNLMILKIIFLFLSSMNSILFSNREKIPKIVKALNLKILPRDMKSKETRTLLTSIFNQWLPLSTTVLHILYIWYKKMYSFFFPYIFNLSHWPS